MKRLRLRILLFVSWIILLFGSQLALEPIGMHKIIYLFIGLAVSLLLIIPGLNRIPVWLVGLISGFAYIALKAALGDLFAGKLVVFTITELSFVVVSTFLAQWVNQGIHEFEAAVVKISIGNNDKISEFAHKGEEVLYREVRRARNHQRPLALLTIGVNENLDQPALYNIMLEAQSALKKQLILSSISKILCEKLADCDIVVQDHDRFLAALPETTSDDIPFLVNRLRQQIADQIGINIDIGVATLPNDGFTLEGLIEKADQNTSRSKSRYIHLKTKSPEFNHPSH